MSSLSKIFTFTILLDTYFLDSRKNLPEDLSDLEESVRDIFPITERSQLSRLRYYKEKLSTLYKFRRIPTEYFDLLPPKPELPITPQELKRELRHEFPFQP